MSMSEPKWKKKQASIKLRDSKPKVWEQESSKFGMSMMKKLGWSEGKGLGKNENGIAEPIKSTVQVFSKGLGYKEPSESDAWLKQSQDFAWLLDSLSKQFARKSDDDDSSDDSENGGPGHKKDKAAATLDETVKNIKSKIYYSKNIKGKDLKANANKRDLKQILGVDIVPERENVSASKKKRKIADERTDSVTGAFENRAFDSTIDRTSPEPIRAMGSASSFGFANPAFESRDDDDDDDKPDNGNKQPLASRGPKLIKFMSSGYVNPIEPSSSDADANAKSIETTKCDTDYSKHGFRGSNLNQIVGYRTKVAQSSS